MFFMTRLKMNRRKAEWTKGSRPSLTPSSVTHYVTWQHIYQVILFWPTMPVQRRAVACTLRPDVRLDISTNRPETNRCKTLAMSV